MGEHQPGFTGHLDELGVTSASLQPIQYRLERTIGRETAVDQGADHGQRHCQRTTRRGRLGQRAYRGAVHTEFDGGRTGLDLAGVRGPTSVREGIMRPRQVRRERLRRCRYLGTAPPFCDSFERPVRDCLTRQPAVRRVGDDRDDLVGHILRQDGAKTVERTLLRGEQRWEQLQPGEKL